MAIDPYYLDAYIPTLFLMIILGRTFVYFVNHNFPFPDHQPRVRWEEISFGIFACGVIQYASGALYHWDPFYQGFAALHLLNSAGLFLAALWPGGVWAAYSDKRVLPPEVISRFDKTYQDREQYQTNPAEIFNDVAEGVGKAAKFSQDVTTIKRSLNGEE